MVPSHTAFDTAVVGAGPAGAICALELARRGLRVVLLDRRVPPRYKTCGGGLVARAHRMLEVDLGPCIETSTHEAELNLLRSGLTFTVRREAPMIFMTMRSELDRLLVEAACAAGAELRAPCNLQTLEQREDGVSLETGDGPLDASFVVGADGAGSTAARSAGWSRPPRLIPALESEVEVNAVEHERFAGRARFDFEIVPAGYAWVFPKRAHLSVGCLSFDRRQPDLGRRLGLYLERLGLATSRRQDHGFVIPVAPRRPLARGRVLLAGDAAGLTDPVTCEGITHAILSGRLAARAIAQRSPDAAAVARAYRRSVALPILRELRVASVLARLLYGSLRVRRLVFARCGQRLSEAMAEVVCGRLTYSRLVRNPTVYLRLASSLLRRGA